MSKNTDADRLAEYYYHKGLYEGLSQGHSNAIKILDEFAKSKADPVIVIKQQEQSCDTCTNDKGCVTCKDGGLWEGKEQSCEDLEAEIGKVFFSRRFEDEHGRFSIQLSLEEFSDIAEHFYELGKNSI